MKNDFDELIFSGFASQHIDFPTVLNDSDITAPEKRDQLDAMIEAATAAESDLLSGTFFCMLIVGHSDRDDTPGRSPEQRRQLELDNSGLRAESAEAFVMDAIFQRLQAQGIAAPVSADSLQFVQLRRIACGAADLLFTTPEDEGERLANRRVQIFGTAFTTPAS